MTWETCTGPCETTGCERTDRHQHEYPAVRILYTMRECVVYGLQWDSGRETCINCERAAETVTDVKP